MSASAWVRSALHEGPSDAAWRMLIQALPDVHPDKLPSLRGLAERRAGAWPPELRRAPPRLWARPAPGLELARSLRVGTPALAQLAWDSPRLRQLCHLEVALEALGPEAEGFFASPRLGGLSELLLEGPAPLGFELGQIWTRDFPRLRRLTLAGVDLGAVDVRLPLPVVRALDELCLRRVSGTGAAWDRLAQMLKAERPSVLRLDELQASEEDAVRLAASEVFARLVGLSLRGLATDRVLRALDFGLDTSGLLELDLSSAPASEDGLARFFTRRRFVVTESLRLRDLRAELRLVGLHGQTFPSLRRLDLRGTTLSGRPPWMDDPGLLARLESLALDGPAAAELATGLRDGAMPALRRLTVDRADGPSLAKLAASAPGLRTLRAPNAALSIGAWAACLQGRSLEALDLGNSRGGDDLAALLGTKTLRSLRWSVTDMTRQGWLRLGPLFAELRDLDIGRATLGKEDVASFQASPRLHAFRWTGPDAGGGSSALAERGVLAHATELHCGALDEAEARALADAAPWAELFSLEAFDPSAQARLVKSHPLVEWRFRGGGRLP